MDLEDADACAVMLYYTNFDAAEQAAFIIDGEHVRGATQDR